ncbi:hypothetical protein MSAN_00584300 [Mycena sanguinolenta]|uniref:F-box domain-containing protein n=1 Tax=Mycena sanguinolenta TaxID=230812 RepID=A0A8H6ZAB0_9AGAR|nr:hypothetical protein MSAN_00584300 [Mycena sanguinolenta]
MSAIEAPVLLGRICSAWRTISLKTPRLWASLHIVEPPSPSPWDTDYEAAAFHHEIARRLEMTKMWLDRSGQCPLSISLWGIVEDSEPTATLQFLQVLIPLAPRWQHIHFTISPFLIFKIMSNIDFDMPWLESVAFHCGNSLQPQNTPCGTFEMLQSARLSSLSIPCCLFATVGRCLLQWNQLTALTIGQPESAGIGCTSEMILLVISKCLQLQSCKLVLCDQRSETSVREHLIVELPFLHSLAIRCPNSTSVDLAISILLQHLSLPELRNFVFLPSWEHDVNCPAFIDFFARSTRLESLDIPNNIFVTPSFHDILRSLPPTIDRLRIRSLPISGWSVSPRRADDAMLQVLTTPGLCPTLRDLVIEQGTDISDAAVLQFITARMLQFSPATLRRFEIKFDRGMTVDIMPSLQSFLETGLTVSLIYPLPFSLSPWGGLDDNPHVTIGSQRRNDDW